MRVSKTHYEQQELAHNFCSNTQNPSLLLVHSLHPPNSSDMSSEAIISDLTQASAFFFIFFTVQGVCSGAQVVSVTC